MFGDIIKILRIQNNMTLKELSNKIGVSLAALGHYERNEREPNLTILCKIADCFDVTTDYLLNRSDYMTRDEDLLCSKIFTLDEDFSSETNKVKLKAIETLRSAYFLVKNFLILGAGNENLSKEQYEKLQLNYLDILDHTYMIINDIFMYYDDNELDIYTREYSELDIYLTFEKEYRKRINEIENNLRPILVKFVKSRAIKFMENRKQYQENCSDAENPK